MRKRTQGTSRQHLQTVVAQKARVGKHILEPILAELLEMKIITVRKQHQMQYWTYRIFRARPGPWSGRPAPDGSDPGEEYWENDRAAAPRAWGVSEDDPVLAAMAAEEAERRTVEERDREAGLE